MCFSKEWSLGFTLFSTGVALWVLSGKGVWKSLENWQRWRVSYCFFYFAAMEGLQFLQYLVINDCKSSINIFLTILGWIHISWQPLFSNFAFSALDPLNHKAKREDTWKFVLKLSFVAGLCMALRIVFPYITTISNDNLILQPCVEEGEGLCAERSCTENGIYHLKWTFKMVRASYVFPGIAAHFLLMFVTPFLLGMRIEAIVLFLTGPAISILFTKASDGEHASIWCFFSIAESFITVFTAYFGCKRQLAKNQGDKKEN